MITLRSVMLLLSLFAIAGCSSHVMRLESADATRPVVKALKDFRVEMSPEAELQLAEDVEFDMNALRANLQITLEGKNLIAPDGNYRLKVVVNDIRVRSTFSAVMWGFMAGDDHLRGDVVVLNLAGEQVFNFLASASYAWGGLGGGQDSSRMNWLYEEFSEVIANELLKKQGQ